MVLAQKQKNGKTNTDEWNRIEEAKQPQAYSDIWSLTKETKPHTGGKIASSINGDG